MTTFSKLCVLFLALFAVLTISACGKKGTPLPPDGCDHSDFVEYVECDFNSFPDTTMGTAQKPCPPEKFPAIYPPE
jgi:hypothetical protein